MSQDHPQKAGGPGSVPFVDLQAAHAEVAAEVEAGLASVMRSGGFILGPEVAAFEEEYAAFCQVRACVALSSGTDALEMALRAAGIEAGDEVVVPVNTFIATALAVVRSGAVPVFVDCNRHALLDVAQVTARLTDRTRALVPVHLYGQMASMAEVMRLAAQHGLVVIEDAAQAQGARQEGRGPGSLSTAAATSFYPAKNLGAYGDAGAVVTNDAGLAQDLAALRNYGSTRKYEHPRIGFNCRLDTLQAVVLRAKLQRLAAWNEARRQAAARYAELLQDLPGVEPMAGVPGNEHVYHLYVVKLPEGVDRDHVVKTLAAAGIGAGIHYPAPLHLTGAFAYLGHQAGEFPVAESICPHIMSLPIFPQITDQQQERVVASLRQALG